jgi:hypothetical protein
MLSAGITDTGNNSLLFKVCIQIKHFLQIPSSLNFTVCFCILIEDSISP